MDYIIIFFLLSVYTWLYFFTRRSGLQKSGVATRLPPGPYPLPIIGNILELGDKPHHSLAAVSKTYGPLMSLKLRRITMIVVSSCEIAQEFFSKHDISFSSRSVPSAIRVIDSHNTSMVWLPVGDQWRRFRRICKEHLFSARQLDASRFLRKQKVQELLDFVHGCRMSGKPINIGETVAITTLNVLSNYIFSTDLAQYDSPSSQEFKNMVWAVMEIAGAPNLADYFPVLRSLDPHGLLRRSKFYNKKLLAIFEHYINELLHDLFLAGTDTTSNTLEWAMAELIHNPEKMLKARAEIKKGIGNDERTFEESDISRVPYLRAIIKETLRLHPLITFLVPHKAITDVEIKGYMVQTRRSCVTCGPWVKTQTFGRTHKGSSQRGRRRCLGLPLADILLHLMLGTLIHKFDWKIKGGIRTKDMDMTDKFGFTLKKILPLMAIPVKL
ncbi:putative geraniol 8-hydroxylase [Helianthus anomalus]